MIRRKRGRPEGPTPLFAEDCDRLDATQLLAKSRGCFVASDPGLFWTLSWPEVEVTQTHTVAVAVVRTKQPLGGSRRWWRCPSCGRRCGVLLATHGTGRVGCRTCMNARYLADYPGRRRRRILWQTLLAVVGPDQEDGGMPELWAPRRRGVRRGRRVLARAIRKFLKDERARHYTLAQLKSLRDAQQL